MERKHNANDINLYIENFIPFINDKQSGFIIEWNSDIGFGEYTIYKSHNSDKWIADSECMDSNKDKDFINKLMSLFIEKLVIEC